MGKAWKYTANLGFMAHHWWWDADLLRWREHHEIFPGFCYRPETTTDFSVPDEIIEVDNETEMRRVLAVKSEVDLSEELLIECAAGKDSWLNVCLDRSLLCLETPFDAVYPSLEDTKRLRDYLSAYIEMKESE